MSARTKGRQRTEKLTLRLAPATKRKIEAAADVQNKSVTAYVLDSALAAADTLLADRSTFYLNTEQWKAFMEALDAPPRYHERLKRLLTEPSVFD
ncbi:MAG TPA: DUF1778 domain-containing protein [Pseudolabrys sp.]|jgi:uncharacterized protein (DUF1778 family)